MGGGLGVNHGVMSTEHADARAAFEGRVRSLRGRRLLEVDYWDVYNYGSDAVSWDYGDWHHAVMGVQLTSDCGPVTVTWTATFEPYGVEDFLEPITNHLAIGEFGPQRVGPDPVSRWDPFLGLPIVDGAISWDTFTFGPAIRADGEVASPSYNVDIPTAVRVDFDAGPVWFVAGMPRFPDFENVLIPGDKIMVVFTAAKMQQMGYTDPTVAG